MTDGLRVQRLTSAERDSLSSLRAAEWHGALSAEQYCKRNRRLFSHPFGTRRIETWGVINRADEILSSLDAMQIDLLVRRGKAEVQTVPGILIASVVTPRELRGRGYARRLFDQYFSEHPQSTGVLYSDIGPPFYRRYGFYERMMCAVEIPVHAGTADRPPEITLEDFSERLRRRRIQDLIQHSATVCAALDPEPAWIDWQVERYRLFAEWKNRSLPAVYYLAEHGGEPHPIGAAADFVADRLDVFWVDSTCPACLDGLHALAAENGISTLRFWAPPTRFSGKAECPMLRVGTEAWSAEAPAFVDPQFCDWW